MINYNNAVDEKRRAGKDLINTHLGIAPSDGNVMRYLTIAVPQYIKNLQCNYLITLDYIEIFLQIFNYSNISKNVKPESSRGGMSGRRKFIFNAFLVYLCLNHVSGEEVNAETSDELLSVRSLRNWVGKKSFHQGKLV